MLDHTKKHHTNKITLFFEGPKENEREAIIVLKALGFMNAAKKTDSISWRDAFPEFSSNEPGTCLVAVRHKNNLTQEALSEITGIPRRHISEMENGKRPIGKKTAKKMSKFLKVDYRVFL
ncbi:MAG: helix-turn-helix transcriptional regulator [Thermodesulfobacteriota bacterium]|nr:helix-turn-helix transcriptional regulator [Thermodesulfobacteriota bacterium]